MTSWKVVVTTCCVSDPASIEGHYDHSQFDCRKPVVPSEGLEASDSSMRSAYSLAAKIL